MKNILIIAFTILHLLAFGQNNKITIIVKVPNQNDNVYIVGNQSEIGNWLPEKVLMKKKSKFERIFEFVPSEFPVEFKFTKGSWEKEAIVEFHQQGNLKINSSEKRIYSYNILTFNQDKITNFDKKYRKKYDGNVIVEIPEVFELVNILMVLHKDAEKEENMFNIETEYYKKVKEYFTPFLNHPIIDTIHKNMGGLRYLDEIKMNVFSDESYSYYYNLRCNSTNYFFNKNKIKHNNYIRYHGYNQNNEGIGNIKHLLEDFAIISNFRKFYKDNQPYYNELINSFNEYNNVKQMNTWLETKFGFKYESYVIYFSPLTGGSHQTSDYSEDEFKQSFMFIANSMPNENLSKAMNEIEIGRVVFTEIDHNFVDPVSDLYIEKINANFSNRDVWAKNDVGGYPSPYQVFNEYMTWAVYCLYVNDYYSQEELNSFLPKIESQMNRRGFNNFYNFNRKLLTKYKSNPNIKMTELYDYILDWSKEENK